MSDFKAIPVGEDAESLEVSTQFNAYSGIEIVDSDGNSELVGSKTGRVLTIEGITRGQAQAILQDLSGFQYQPYTASKAILNPAAEIGDAVTVNDVYSGIYKLSRNYEPNMSSDIEAPKEEEVDHEYPYEPKQDRVYKREIAQARAQIKLNTDSIEAEVFRATESEGTLQSLISQNASEISAKVSKSGGDNSSFSWVLNDNSWTLYSGGSEVFKATSNGVEVTGIIKATSGKIGGFTIGSSSLYNGMNNIDSTSKGVYVGTSGIAVGGGAFKVTSSGTVSANDMTLTGTLTIGGKTITAAKLRNGAQSAYDWANTKDANGYTAETKWNTGSGYGYNYNNATKRSGGSYPDFYRASTLSCSNIIITSGITWGTQAYSIGLVAKDSAMYVLGI